MICSSCGGSLKVEDTGNDDLHVYRRRICTKCGKKMYTTEAEIPGSKLNLSLTRNGSKLK